MKFSVEEMGQCSVEDPDIVLCILPKNDQSVGVPRSHLDCLPGKPADHSGTAIRDEKI